MLKCSILTENRLVLGGKTTNGQKCAVFWKGGFEKISEKYGALGGALAPEAVTCNLLQSVNFFQGKSLPFPLRYFIFLKIIKKALTKFFVSA